MNMYKFAKDENEEEKSALNLTPEMISAIQSDSAQIDPKVEEAKNLYISQARGKTLAEHGEILEELWSDYLKAISRLPKTPHEEFPDFETWYQENKNFLTQWFDQHFKTPKNPFPFSQLYGKQEEPIEEEEFIKTQIAPSIYYKAMALDKFSQIGVVPANQTENPITDFNNLMASYSRGLANYFTNQLNTIEQSPNKVATFVIGYPGAGKSSIIELEDSEKENPIRQTKYGTLIDPDEFQPLLPGYSLGARSQDVLIYAKQLVAKKLQDEALQRGLSFVNPQVGGQSNILAKDIAEALLHGFQVKVILKPTSKEESQRRTIERAVSGGRLIMPLLGKTDPEQSFNDLKENPDLIKQKIITEIKNRIKSGDTQNIITDKALSDSELENLLSRVSFEIADENIIANKSLIVGLLRIASVLDNKEYHTQADKVIDIAINILGLK